MEMNSVKKQLDTLFDQKNRMIFKNNTHGFKAGLDYFINKQYLISKLTSGDVLTYNESDSLVSNGKTILKFSQNFINQIAKLKERNYILKSAKVNFILYWLKEGAEQEIKIILPELYFEKLIQSS